MTRLGCWPEGDADGASRESCLLIFLGNWQQWWGNRVRLIQMHRWHPMGRFWRCCWESSFSILAGWQPGISIVKFKKKTHRLALWRGRGVQNQQGSEMLVEGEGRGCGIGIRVTEKWTHIHGAVWVSTAPSALLSSSTLALSLLSLSTALLGSWALWYSLSHNYSWITQLNDVPRHPSLR